MGVGGLHFGGENEGVHRDESLHAVAMEVFHELVEIRVNEVVRAQAGVETRQAEIDGVGPGGDRGTGAIPVSRGCEEFELRA
jgi:hypothetical protein